MMPHPLRSLTLAALLSLAALPARAQESLLFGVLKVRESADDKNKTDKPATFFAQWPEGKDALYTADIAISGNLLPNSPRWSVEPTMEFHRKTDIAKRQDTRLGGLKASLISGNAVTRAHYFGFSVQYKDDRVKKEKGVQSGLNYLPLIPGAAIGASRGSDSFRFRWQPALAMEFSGIERAAAGRPTGDALRFFTGADLYFYPLFRRHKDRVELLVTAKQWTDVSKSTALGTKKSFVTLTRVAATTYFGEARHIGLSIERVEGTDVTLGLEDQKFWQLGVRVMF